MIVVDEGETLRIITQPDHARFAAELLSLWRTDNLPTHPRRQQLLFAVREHDNGWREADAAPSIDPDTQRPLTFDRYPESARLEIWQRAILRFAEQQPYASLLIAKHAETIHRPLTTGWQNLFDQIEEVRRQWIETAGTNRAEVESDYRYLQLADTLSLAYCRRQPGAVQASMTAKVDAEYLRLRPFPLAGTTTFHIPVRRIANRAYRTDAEAGSALVRARWGRLPVKVAAL